MRAVLPRQLPGGIHYAWLALGATFLTMITGAAVRATPSILINPLEQAFGWSPAIISLAISINLLLFGLMGPFAAALMQRIGIRRTILGALTVIGLTVLSSSFITHPWQLILTWGLFVGGGCGLIATVLGAVVTNRWFSARRGLALGILTASNATGQLAFLPLLAAVATGEGWRYAVWIVAGAVAVIIPIVAFLLPERPSDVGQQPYGDTGERPMAPPSTANPVAVAFTVLGRAVKSRDFWVLSASFFVCGASTNGLVGTHLISYCIDNGIPEVRGASLLAAMGIFDIVGTTLSGWLSDRYSSRALLFWYYGLRGLSLLYLPYSGFSLASLSVFAMFYGLDWIATVPPTVRVANEVFGRQDAPVIFGWIFVAHQVGASAIALTAGALRTALGSYQVPFMLSGALCLMAAMLVLRLNRPQRGARPLGPVPSPST